MGPRASQDLWLLMFSKSKEKSGFLEMFSSRSSKSSSSVIKPWLWLIKVISLASFSEDMSTRVEVRVSKTSTA